MSEAEKLLAEAERRYRLKIFDNISRERLMEMPVADRCRVVGRAIMFRCDMAAFRLGRKLVRMAESHGDASAQG